MWSSIKPFGRSCVLIEWHQIIHTSILAEISAIRKGIESKQINGIVDVVPGYTSLTVFFMPEVISYAQILEIIDSSEKESPEIAQEEGIIWEISVEYNKSQDKDMASVMSLAGLSRNEIVDLHTSTLYDVYFIGFLPGFLYLGGLDEKLHIPRKIIPDLKILSGSVAIGGAQTGIYPQESPGGWYVIGHTDFKVIDFYSPPFCQVKPGDRVKFSAI
ncbi:MAG: 5-oxoprolinase subunit PxpB [Saprospiraceae bacterium]|nr:5-oxoprolinase subunit PxpB [Saprospiraceae bacterium]MBP6565891.1 5-oxoprolinase subunit PxpB [Saprospiraceae bacterium]